MRPQEHQKQYLGKYEGATHHNPTLEEDYNPRQHSYPTDEEWEKECEFVLKTLQEMLCDSNKQEDIKTLGIVEFLLQKHFNGKKQYDLLEDDLTYLQSFGNDDCDRELREVITLQYVNL